MYYLTKATMWRQEIMILRHFRRIKHIMEKYSDWVKVKVRTWWIVVPIKFYNVFVTLQNLEQPHITNLTDKRSFVVNMRKMEAYNIWFIYLVWMMGKYKIILSCMSKQSRNETSFCYLQDYISSRKYTLACFYNRTRNNTLFKMVTWDHPMNFDIIRRPMLGRDKGGNICATFIAKIWCSITILFNTKQPISVPTICWSIIEYACIVKRAVIRETAYIVPLFKTTREKAKKGCIWRNLAV